MQDAKELALPLCYYSCQEFFWSAAHFPQSCRSFFHAKSFLPLFFSFRENSELLGLAVWTGIALAGFLRRFWLTFHTPMSFSLSLRPVYVPGENSFHGAWFTATSFPRASPFLPHKVEVDFPASFAERIFPLAGVSLGHSTEGRLAFFRELLPLSFFCYRTLAVDGQVFCK